MKELRFSAADRGWHVAFAFGPKRRALLLVAGDKSGDQRETLPPRPDRKRGMIAVTRTLPGCQGDLSMPVGVNETIAKLSPARRKKVEDRATELIAEEMTLRQLRKARKLTQVRMAKTLGISQDGVASLEKRTDVLLSTRRKAVEAMGAA